MNFHTYEIGKYHSTVDTINYMISRPINESITSFEWKWKRKYFGFHKNMWPTSQNGLNFQGTQLKNIEEKLSFISKG